MAPSAALGLQGVTGAQEVPEVAMVLRAPGVSGIQVVLFVVVVLGVSE